MRGKTKIYVKNRHITFSFTLEKNVIVITGDSGTGKTKLINMVSDYSDIFAGNNYIKNILTEPVDYIESQEFFSCEQFFYKPLS
ncbi:MAG: hypothetical protein K2K16_09770 [Ruminococcus sp.]|nr:hypothetical protein [Ruminococcus sp.]MDE6672470.1 hypothetical protein [Ruminococcus sp.]